MRAILVNLAIIRLIAFIFVYKSEDLLTNYYVLERLF